MRAQRRELLLHLEQGLFILNMYVYVCMYVFVEREKERERQRGG
jgi:hypothetical protein